MSMVNNTIDKGKRIAGYTNNLGSGGSSSSDGEPVERKKRPLHASNNTSTTVVMERNASDSNMREKIANPNDRISKQRDDGNDSTDTMAEACSASLRGITDTSAAARLKKDVDTSSSSSAKSNPVAFVTGTASQFTSSADDRESSGSDQRNNKSSNSTESMVSVEREKKDLRSNRLLEHHHRDQNDGHRLGAAQGEEHTTVVAHLLLPSADSAAYSSSASGGSGDKIEAAAEASLLEPYPEPSLHTIRKTFSKLTKREAMRKSAKQDDSDEDVAPPTHKRKRGATRQDEEPQKKRSSTKTDLNRSDCNNDDSGGSSGSGTEGGYAGSASSNCNGAQVGSCSSPSSDDSYEVNAHKKTHQSSADHIRPLISRKEQVTHSMSSEIADFSSSASGAESFTMNAFEARSESPSITSSSNDGALYSNDDLPEDDAEEEDSQVCAKKVDDDRKLEIAKELPRKHAAQGWPPFSLQVPAARAIGDREKKKKVHIDDRKPAAKPTGKGPILEGKPPVLALGCDVMAHVLTFLEPPDILDVLTMPLSKDWIRTFTRQPELWRVLCLLEPFKARVDEEGYDSSSSSDDDSIDRLPFYEGSQSKAFGKFRLLYTSFVRCMRYLLRIKDDAVNGRPLSVIDYAAQSDAASGSNIRENQNLQQFLSRARGVMAPVSSRVVEQVANDGHVGLSDDESLASNSATELATRAAKRPSAQKKSKDPKKKVKYGHSKLTQRLLGPSLSGDVREVELPWSCGIYSIVNWMVAFSEVEGIQTMCLKVLPFILENEQQRITAQRAGLTDIVLRAMVLFPDSSQLHTAAFHTIVLLARPLGGREGMLFHTSMVNSSGIFSSTERGAAGGKSGIAVLLDSMRRFADDEVLQAMSCWSLVNIALAPVQKEVLVKLGGIEVVALAMLQHPYNAEVQFRALFALINLVIPSVGLPQQEQPEPETNNEDGVSSSDEDEREIFDVDQIVHLVVLSMKNFCSNEAILNRACLVLHNLSLTAAYHSSMLWTPNCYQMLEWCLGNYRTDQVLQQSAAGTLHRLQLTLSSDERLRTRFAASIQAQQQLSLEQAHREALLLHEQQDRAAQELQNQQRDENRECEE